MGIQPNVWGPSLWMSIHLICMGAPAAFHPTEAAHYKAFFQHLGPVLPCEACREHYAGHMASHGAALDQALQLGKDALFRWSVDLHNAVNKQNGKRVWSYEEAQAFWSAKIEGQVTEDAGSPHATQGKRSSTSVWIILGLVVFIPIAAVVAVRVQQQAASRRR